MRLTKEEKERLMELLDVMSDRCPDISIGRFNNDRDRALFYRLFKMLRLELYGY